MLRKHGGFLRNPKLLNTKAVVIPLQILNGRLLHLTPPLQVNAVLLLLTSYTMTMFTAFIHHISTAQKDFQDLI